MRRRNPLETLAAVVVLALGVSMVISCSKKSTEPVAGGPCEQKAAQAATALENILYDEINSDPQRPSDIDFQSAYQLYQEALLCDATNSNANFGVAVLGLLALTSDAEVNSAFDEWKIYLDAHTPFEVPATRLHPLGVPLSFAGGPEALRLPFDLASYSVVALAKPHLALADPQLGQAQTILETRVLPRLTQALSRLGVVAANRNYRFVVTPRMQGDVDASPVEIDHTDVLALRAACGLLASFCNVAISYDLNFAAYDSLGLLQALTPGSGWMALRPQGALHMASAGTTLSGAVDDLDAAISSLLAESDPQDDDVIKIGPDGVSAAEAESIQVHLDDVRAGLAQGYTRVDDWDGDFSTPDVPLTIRVGQLFTNPIPDWKALFPAYTPSVTRRSRGSYPLYAAGSAQADVVAPSDGSFYASYSLSVQDGQTTYESFSGDEFLRSAVTQTIQDQLQVAQTTPNWTGGFSGFASFNGPLTIGSHTVAIPYQTYTYVATSYAYAPVITWTADTFDEWVWPNPTFNGILPGMGSSSQLLSTFGITAAQWTKQVELAQTGGEARAVRRRPLP